MEIRIRSDTLIEKSACTYSNTAVRKCRYTLLKQSTLEHNLNFENIILSIIGWIFVLSTAQKHNRQFQSIISSSLPSAAEHGQISVMWI